MGEAVGVDAVGIALVALVMAVGLLGTILPFVPGLPIVWAAALAYGVVAGFGAVGWASFAAITVLLILGIVGGLVLPHRRVAAKGAPASTIVAGIAGGIIGFFVIPVVGLPLGALAAVLAAERLRIGDWAQAWRSTKEMLVGFGIGVLVQLAAGSAMVAVWIVWVLVG